MEQSECSSEHIVPLALGGLNGFEIPVSKKMNSEIGAEIDGALSNDFIISAARNEFDIRGHTGTRPVQIMRKGVDNDTGNPIQVTLDRQTGLTIWDAKSRSYISAPLPSTFSFSFSLDIDLPTRFVAKVALSAGYFCYGDDFRKYVEHKEFREVMNHDKGQSWEEFRHLKMLADTPYQMTESAKLKIIRLLCRASKPHSIVGLVPNSSGFGVFVGILGHYMGTLTAPADTSKIPNTGDFKLGHVIQLNRPEKKIIRISLEEALAQLARSH